MRKVIIHSGEELAAIAAGLGLIAVAVLAGCLVYALGGLPGALATGVISGLAALLLTQDSGLAWGFAILGFWLAILIYLKAMWGGSGGGGGSSTGGYGGGSSDSGGFTGGGGSFGGGGSSGSW